MTQQEAMELAAWLVGGGILGGLYLHLIARSVSSIEPPASVAPAIGWFLIRVVLAALVMWAAATQGAAQLVAALMGFLLARTILLDRMAGPR